LEKEASLKAADPHPTEPTPAEVAADQVDPVIRLELMRREVELLVLQAALTSHAPPPDEEREALRDLSPFGQ
jgi:hypothetical protein